MMDKRIDMIPLRDAWKGSRKKRASKAIKLVKQYATRHTKSKIVKISKQLNEKLWFDGCQNIPRKVKVQILTDKVDSVSWIELADVEFVKPMTKVEKADKSKKAEEKKKAEADIAKKEADAKKSAQKRSEDTKKGVKDAKASSTTKTTKDKVKDKGIKDKKETKKDAKKDVVKASPKKASTKKPVEKK